jgi:hypothetical protein
LLEVYIYIYTARERERDGEESGVVRCHCLKYIYIYIYLCIYTLSHTHRWRGERCGALSVLGRERARARHMHKTSRTSSRKLLALPNRTPARAWGDTPNESHGPEVRVHVSESHVRCL